MRASRRWLVMWRPNGCAALGCRFGDVDEDGWGHVVYCSVLGGWLVAIFDIRQCALGRLWLLGGRKSSMMVDGLGIWTIPADSLIEGGC